MSDYERQRGDPYPTIDVDLWLPDGSPALGLVAADVSATRHWAYTALSGIPLLDLATVTATHTPGGFIELDPTYAAGVYRLDLAAGILLAEPDVTVIIVGANIRPRKLTIAIIQPTTTPPDTGVVLADLRMINGVYINGSGVEGDEFQP